MKSLHREHRGHEFLDAIGGMFDAHADTATVLEWGVEIDQIPSRIMQIVFGKNYLQWNIPYARKARLIGQIFGLWTFPRPQGEALASIESQIDAVERTAEKHREDLVLCKRPEDFKNADKDKRTRIGLAVEGSHAFKSVEELERLKRRGIMAIGLAHFCKSSACCSAGPFGGPKDQGLSKLGFDLVRRSEELGLITDLAHMNQAGFKDVLSTVKDDTRLIISHTAMAGVYNHWRNTTDEQAKAIADKGGVICIMDSKRFIIDPHDKPSKDKELDAAVAHFKYLYNLVGEDSIGIGADHDGLGGTLHRYAHTGEAPNLVKKLLEELHPDIVEKIVRKNVERLLTC